MTQAGFVDPKQPIATVRPIDFENAAKKACTMKLEEGKSKFPLVEEENLPYLCMDLVYQYTLLIDGFGTYLNTHKNNNSYSTATRVQKYTFGFRIYDYTK